MKRNTCAEIRRPKLDAIWPSSRELQDIFMDYDVDQRNYRDEDPPELLVIDRREVTSSMTSSSLYKVREKHSFINSFC